MKKNRFELPYLTKAQRKGVLVMSFLVMVLQGIIIGFQQSDTQKENVLDMKETQKWEQQWDSLKRIQETQAYAAYQYNPNFLKADRAKFLGLNDEQWQRLQAFRSKNLYVNSAKEFQKITQISDSLLHKLEPQFKFPEWVTEKQRQGYQKFEKKNLPIKDINTAELEDLKAISGVGDVLAKRILEERQKVKGFVAMEQLHFVYGLNGTALDAVKEYFVIRTKPTIYKVDIATASKEELLQIPYVNATLAKNILVYRSKLDRKMEVSDLEKINGMPLDRLKIIALYLNF